MDQPLDLSITLTPPPDGSPPEAIASTQLRCDQLGLRHDGDLLADPLTTKEREQIRWYLAEYWEWPYEQFLERGKKIAGACSPCSQECSARSASPARYRER